MPMNRFQDTNLEPNMDDIESRPSSSKSGMSTRPSSVMSTRPSSGMSTRAPSAKSRPPTARPSSSKSRPGSGRSVLAWEPSKVEEANGAEDADNVTDMDGESMIDMEGRVISDKCDLLEGVEPPTGCWQVLTNCLGMMWYTKEMNLEPEQEIVIRTTLRELAVYVMFLVLCCFMVFGGSSTDRFTYTQLFKDHFSAVEGVDQVEKIWDYLLHNGKDDNGLISSLYPMDWYNKGDIPEMEESRLCPGARPVVCGEKDWKCKRAKPCPLVDADRNVLYENKMLGVPRLRQVRIRNDSCEIHEFFKQYMHSCYSHYTPVVIDTGNFGPGWRRFTSSDAWRYRSPKELKSSDFWGALSTYGGGGAVQNLHSKRNISEAIIRELRESLWLSRSTRLLTIDFTLYNANVNYFCVVTLAFEFPPTGGVIPRTSFRTVKLIKYINAWDYLMLACDIIFVFFIIYYIVEESLEIKHLKGEYFQSFWNLMDLCVIIISLLTISIQVYIAIAVSDLIKPLLAEPDIFGDFTTLAHWTDHHNSIFAINIFLAWVKIFKYISFNQTMKQLSDTLVRAFPDVVAFSVMFYIIFFAFVQVGYLVFGSILEDFSTFGKSSYTLMRAILGDFDFPAMEGALPNIGPAFFILYIFVAFFILLNMFLAIINDTYSEVKAELAGAKVEFQISDYFVAGYNNILGVVSMRNKMIDVENALKLANDDGCITYEEVRESLKKCNFSDAEIEMFFGKGDFGDDGEIDIEESNELFDEFDDDRPLSGKRARSARSARIKSGMTSGRVKSPNDLVTNDEFDELEERVDRMEHSIGSIVSKIDAVLTKLDAITNKTKLEKIPEDDDDKNTPENGIKDELINLDDPEFNMDDMV